MIGNLILALGVAICCGAPLVKENAPIQRVADYGNDNHLDVYGSVGTTKSLIQGYQYTSYYYCDSSAIFNSNIQDSYLYKIEYGANGAIIDQDSRSFADSVLDFGVQIGTPQFESYLLGNHESYFSDIFDDTVYISCVQYVLAFKPVQNLNRYAFISYYLFNMNAICFESPYQYMSPNFFECNFESLNHSSYVGSSCRMLGSGYFNDSDFEGYTYPQGSSFSWYRATDNTLQYRNFVLTQPKFAFNDSSLNTNSKSIYVLPFSIYSAYEYAEGVVPSINFNTCLEYVLEVNAGYGNGYESGYQTGYNDGFTTGISTGYSNGYAEGLRVGTGANANVLNLFGAIADTPIRFLKQMFSFEVFGMNVAVIILSCLTAVIVFGIVKKVWK